MITPELLNALLSPDAGQRQQAETYWQGLAVDQRAPALVQVLQSSTAAGGWTPLQHLAAILLRRDVFVLANGTENISLLEGMAVEQLLPFFVQSPQPAIGDCLAAICSMLQTVLQQPSSSHTKSSSSTMQAVLNATVPMVSQGQASALKLWTALAEEAPRDFCQVALPNLSSVLAAALQQQTNNNPQLLDCVVPLVVQAAHTTNSVDKGFNYNEHLVSLATTCLAPLWQQPQPQSLPCYYSDVVLEALNEAATQVPSLLLLPNGGAQQQSWIQSFATYLCRAPVHLQLSALQVVVTLCTTETVAESSLALLRAALAQEMIPQTLRRLQHHNDDDDAQEWADEPASLQDDDFFLSTNDTAYAALLLQDAVRVCGRPVLVDLVLPQVQQWAASNEWKSRQAALVTLGCAAQALSASFGPYVPAARDLALQHLVDASQPAKVQFHAIGLLGWVLENEQNTNKASADPALWQALVRATQSPCTRLAAAACCALVSLARAAEEATVAQFLSDSLQALGQGPLSLDIRQPGAVAVQTRALGALAALAQASGAEAFSPHYAATMSGLKTAAGQHVDLRDTALEAAALVGQVVGPQVFAADGESLLQDLLYSPSSGEPTLEQLVTCARMASAMGDHYAPHAQVVLPHLLQRATEATDVEISDGNEQDLAASKGGKLKVDQDTGMESMTVAVPGKGLTKVTINTTRIQEKALATRAVYEHARAMGALFAPYCKTCLDAFLPSLRFKYSAEIRATAAETLAAVFEATSEAGEASSSMDLAQACLPTLAKEIADRIHQEGTEDMENLFALADSLSSVFYSVYSRLGEHRDSLLRQFSLDDARLVVQHCMASMVACLQRRDKIAHEMDKATTEDELQDCQQLLATEDDLLTPLVDSVGYTLKFFKEHFVPIFEAQVAPTLSRYLQGNSNDLRARVSAICLFDDAVEHCGPDAAAKFSAALLEGALSGMDPRSGDEDLIRASIYGIAQIARYAPAGTLNPHAQAVVSRIVSYACGPKEEASNLGIFENAVSALASLVLFEGAPLKGTSYIKADNALELFLSNLPLEEDEDEAQICHAGLCKLVERTHIDPVVLMKVIGDTLALVADGFEVANQETCIQFTRILLQLQQQVPQEEMTRTFHGLSAESQQAINAAIGNNAHLVANVVSP